MAINQYRFRLAWQTYRVGDVIEPTGVLREWLRANGYIEPVVVEPTGNPVVVVSPEQLAVKRKSKARKHDVNDSL